ncbi:methyltransferase family protein [Pseudoalteromonas fenneropenaei]|uniref:Methyltransferase family protein n=1 Tax=Pseudoalteromonas fenneropenaei TaxID=1737459 RepID=A0ABV7CQ27_9GAMM
MNQQLGAAHWLETRIPPLLLTALFGLLFWLVACYSWRLSPPLWLTVCALALWCVGLAIMLNAFLTFRLRHTTVDPRTPTATASLVTNGIFAYSRNPMYLGMALILLGLFLILAAPLNLLLWASFIAYLQRFQIAPEERAMVALFGSEYLHYCQQVRRWI